MSFNRNYFLLFVTASVFFLLVALSLQLFENSRLPQYLADDESSFLDAARMIYEDFTVHPKRPFLFPLIAGLPFVAGIDQSRHFYFVFAVNIVCWVTVVFLIYNILRRITSNLFAITGSLLFIVNVGNIAITNQILAEPVYTLVLTLISFFLFRAIVLKKNFYYFMAFLAMSVSIIIKPGLIFLFLIFLLIIVFVFLKNFKFSDLTGKNALLFYAAFALLILQCGLMKKEYGNFTVSYIDRLALYRYIGSQVKANTSGLDLKEIMQKRRNFIEEKKWDEVNKICIDELEFTLTEYPAIFFNSFLMNIIENSSVSSYGILKSENITGSDIHPYSKKIFLYISLFQNIAYSILSVVLLIILLIKIFFFKKQSRLNLYLLINLVICVFIIVSSGVSFWQGDRFHTVFVPLCIISIISLLYSKPELRWRISFLYNIGSSGVFI